MKADGNECAFNTEKARMCLHSYVHLVTFSMGCVGKLVILLTTWRMVWAWLGFWVLWFFSWYLPELPSSCPSLWKVARALLQLTASKGVASLQCVHTSHVSAVAVAVGRHCRSVSRGSCLYSAAFFLPRSLLLLARGKTCFLYKI